MAARSSEKRARAAATVRAAEVPTEVRADHSEAVALAQPTRRAARIVL
jgi:hypothetical protein